LERAIALEREAHTLRSDHKIDEAFNAYDQAGSLYRDAGEHLKAAVCFASAATCWNIHTGWQPLRHAATRNQMAAEEAMKVAHYEYARSLFREAAILYEREGDSENYSACFWGSQIADAKRSLATFMNRSEESSPAAPNLRLDGKERLVALLRWAANTHNRLLWGYGERPFRAFLVACFVIFGSTLAYAFFGHFSVGDTPRQVSFLEAVYFSFVTFTTVGYGDYTALGWTRVVAVLEALSGVFLIPLFVVALTRRYLRMYR
jgi:hypothetical protein